MSTTIKFTEIDLHPDEKKLILKLAPFFVTDKVTLADLKNARKKWIRFHTAAVDDIIGELSYHYNRSRSAYQSEQLDELINHLENALSVSRKNLWIRMM